MGARQKRSGTKVKTAVRLRVPSLTPDQLICIPYSPRPLQWAIHDGMARARYGAVVCHRRFGKTVAAIAHLLRAAITATTVRPRFAYVGPTYRQAKNDAWDYLKHYSRAVVGRTVNESELRVDFPRTNAQVRLFGADNPDSLRGMYLDGVVLDEYGLMPHNAFSEVIRPMLADRHGWALFLGTPNGKNQFYDVIQQSQRDSGWFYASYKASETNVLSDDELAEARQHQTADEYAQEFECSFEASVKGAVWAREVAAARADGRICRVPYDPALPVDTDWDLGYGDYTAIWFSQSFRSREIRLIDFYEQRGQGLAHYAQILKERQYSYGTHWAPHDIQVHELGSGNTRLQAARDLGLNFLVSPKIERLEDGIHAGRMLFPRCWFDAEKCRRGLEALQHYRYDFNSKMKEFTNLPVHDWASHGADAFRGLAFRHYTQIRCPEREAAADVRRAQRDTQDVNYWHRKTRAPRGGYA